MNWFSISIRLWEIFPAWTKYMYCFVSWMG